MRIELSVGVALAALPSLASPRVASAQDSTLVCHVTAVRGDVRVGNGKYHFLTPIAAMGRRVTSRRCSSPGCRSSDSRPRARATRRPRSRCASRRSTRAICESMSGTNTDYSCHTVDRAAITVRQEEAEAKQIPRLDVIARCSDPKVSVSFAQFGRYAAEMLAYTAAGARRVRVPRRSADDRAVRCADRDPLKGRTGVRCRA